MAKPSPAPSTLAADRLIPLPEVARRTGNLHRVTIWRAIKDKQFPGPVLFGRRRFWIEREIDAWIAERKAARDEAECLVMPAKRQP